MAGRPKGKWQQVLAEAHKRFSPGNAYGVVGYGIGRRRVGKRRRRERALTVFVQTKHAAPPKPVPSIVIREQGRRVVLRPDLRATGLVPRALAGEALPHGLGCGSPIRVPVTDVEAGGVACILGTTGVPTHLVTAGHLFFPNGAGTSVEAGMPADGWTAVGRLSRNLLDDEAGLDGALVELTEAGRQMAIRTRSLITGGQLKLPIAAGARDIAPDELVFAFPPTRSEWSDATAIEPLDGSAFHLIAPRRGTFVVTDGIRTKHALTVAGDSGSGLLVEDGERTLLVGLCSGGDASGSCFTNAKDVVARLLALTPAGTFMWG